MILSRGSSPWARGTQQIENEIQGKNRFIPVGTGNTHHSVLACNPIAVHPRGHGEHVEAVERNGRE